VRFGAVGTSLRKPLAGGWTAMDFVERTFFVMAATGFIILAGAIALMV
jgi:hypothetical protein